MDIQQCFEILEIKSGASLDEAKQAYKDIVNVWHPDRFSDNPRLKQKGEEKLKEVNVAYEQVKSLLSGKQEAKPKQQAAPQAKAETEAEYHKARAGRQSRDTTEVLVEAGTRTVLAVCSYLYRTLHRIIVSQVAEAEPQTQARPGRPNHVQGQSRGMGRGKGMGRGGRRGRGRGRV